MADRSTRWPRVGWLTIGVVTSALTLSGLVACQVATPGDPPTPADVSSVPSTSDTPPPSGEKPPKSGFVVWTEGPSDGTWPRDHEPDAGKAKSALKFGVRSNWTFTYNGEDEPSKLDYQLQINQPPELWIHEDKPLFSEKRVLIRQRVMVYHVSDKGHGNGSKAGDSLRFWFMQGSGIGYPDRDEGYGRTSLSCPTIALGDQAECIVEVEVEPEDVQNFYWEVASREDRDVAAWPGQN